MSSTLLPCYEPQEAILGIDRFAVTEVSEDAAPDEATTSEPPDWDEAHRLISKILLRMAEQIARRWSSIRSKAGRTSGQSFSMFAHQVFDLPADQAGDAVVVGVNFEPSPDRKTIVVRGDISGETTGRIWYELGEEQIANSRVAVLAAAHEVASKLSQQWQVVADALGVRRPAA